MARNWLQMLLIAALAVAPGLAGCATAGGSAQEPSPQAAEADTPPPGGEDSDTSFGSGVSERAQNAVEGLLLGAVVGAQAGPFGAAAGAGALMLYAAVTGHVPLSGGAVQAPSRPDVEEAERRREEELEEELDHELDDEVERARELEQQIQAELDRQERLLEQMAAERSAGARSGATGGDLDLSDRANPRIAPRPPEDRELPLALFEKQTLEIPAGQWGNARDLTAIARSLDADEDGHPEQIRYFDELDGAYLRKEQDRDYDGRIDAWHDFEDGALVRRVLDEGGDGEPDVWESYRDGRMSQREVDRDEDGLRDAFYTFAGDSLIQEEHDSNADGDADLIVTYQDRVRVRVEEDRDLDGRFDHWTDYRAVGSRELVWRVERDTSGDGKIDLSEFFDTETGEPVIARREEDKNGDGEADVVSIYRNGKLVRREINDPDLVPL